jgi:hypothetical protein
VIMFPRSGLVSSGNFNTNYNIFSNVEIIYLFIYLFIQRKMFCEGQTKSLLDFFKK